MGMKDEFHASLRRVLAANILRYLVEVNTHPIRAIDREYVTFNSRGELTEEFPLRKLTIPPFPKLVSEEMTQNREARWFLDLCTAEVRLAPRISIRGQHGNFLLSQLSDGERRLFSLFVDIARRLSLSEGRLGFGLIPAIILIDEIDVHLHPTWQRRIVNALRELFPACQFIATTHSPFVIQTAREGEVKKLDGELAVEPSGRSIEEVTRFALGVKNLERSPRFLEMIRTAHRYLDLVESARRSSPVRQERIREELMRMLAPFSDNPAYVALLERRGMIAPNKEAE